MLNHFESTERDEIKTISTFNLLPSQLSHSKSKKLNLFLDQFNEQHILLYKVFCNNHLNKFDEKINHFYWHTNKVLYEGSFMTCYLGEDNNGHKVCILKTKKNYTQQINEEKYILQKIKWPRFPPLYDVLYSDSHVYFIEGLMDFNLKSLFKIKICDFNFDLFNYNIII